MAALTLCGPYRLMSGVIRTYVPPGVAGVFVLGPIVPGGLHPVDAVGRADRDLAAALTGLVGSNSGFMFATASSPTEAFGMEWALYHENILTARRLHPVAPSDIFLRCPNCGLAG